MSKAPKARSCYICGRQYMLHSFAIHETQCRAMFEKWENQKPAKDRRKCPEDPMRGYNPNMSMKELDRLNADSQQVWSEQALVRCQNCNRTFLPEKLPIHQRSCTASNPARRVEAPVKDSREDSLGMSGSIRNGSGKYNNAFDENETVNMNSGNLMQCQNCGRSFNAIPYSKHIKICAKVFTKPRKVFNSAKQRMQGTELEQFAKQTMRGGKTSSAVGASKRPAGPNTTTTGQSTSAASASRGGEMPKWKQDSLRFRNAMKAAREVSRAEKKSKETGIPLHLLLPAGPSGGSRGGTGGGARAGRQEWDDGGYGGGNAAGGGSGAYQESGALQCPTCGRTFSQKAGERHIPQCKNIIAKPSRLNRHSGAPSYSTMSAESTGRQLGTFGSVGSRMTPSSGNMGGVGGGGGGGMSSMGGMGGMSSSGGGFGGGGGGGQMQRPPMGAGGRSTLANTTSTAPGSVRQSVRQSSSQPGSRPGSAGLRGAGAAAVGSSYGSSRPSPRTSEPMPMSGGGGGGFGGGARSAGSESAVRSGGLGVGVGGAGGAGGYRISSGNATSSDNPLMGGRW